MREEDPKKNTQARVAALLGVTRQAMAKWSEPNATGCNGFKPKPDARVVVSVDARPVVGQRISSGEPAAQVAR